MNSTSTNNKLPGGGWASESVFQIGKGKRKSLSIPLQVLVVSFSYLVCKHFINSSPNTKAHELNRKKLVNVLHAERGLTHGIVLLKGGKEISVYDSDTTYLFR